MAEKQSSANPVSCDLAVVMPVHNEEACIAAVIRSWLDMLGTLAIRFRLVVLDDGSTDHTGAILDALAADPHLQVLHHANRGHGPTILIGYRLGSRIAEWVFQCDSDDEIGPEAFPDLWARRAEHDAVVGTRARRHQSWDRRWISGCSRLVVRLCFGGAVTDVNCPFRLIRADLLRRIVEQIPSDTFAPNLLLSGALSRAGARVQNLPVPHRHRRTGSVSIVKWRLWRSVLRSLGQTVRWRLSDDAILRRPPCASVEAERPRR